VRPPNLAQNQPRFTIAAEVVGMEDRFDVLEAVAGQARDLRHCRLGNGKTNHRRSPQIMKRETADASTGRPYAFVRIKRTALPIQCLSTNELPVM
jgi:hypothetical protein